VHFYFYLTEHMQTSVDPSDEATHTVFDNAVAYAEYFSYVRTGTDLLLRKRRRRFKWKPISSPEALKRKFLASYKKLTDTKTPLEERYYHLMVLSQLQLIFLGTVFI
jgi:hypothetical protein